MIPALLMVVGTLAFPQPGSVMGLQDREPDDDSFPAPQPTTRTQAKDQAIDSGEAAAQIQSMLNSVDSAEPGAVAKALGVELVSKYTDISDSPVNVLSTLGDLDGHEAHELLLKWWDEGSAQGQTSAGSSSGTAWALFLVARDGAHWRPSQLLNGSEAFDLALVNLPPANHKHLAITLYHGETQIPFPLIFDISVRPARIVWDGRSDDTLYKGYDYGRLEFEQTSGDGSTRMTVTGREDPGLLVFPKDSERGFAARTTYVWNGKAFAPAKVEYSINPDYTLYRFISALHLLDFKGAYALTDPKNFLGDEEPTLEKFKKQIEDSWPEFLDDQIFEARVTGSESKDYSFALPESPQRYVYYPKFSADGQRIVGLERRAGK